MPDCAHCGDDHGPTPCRQALSILLADQRVEAAEKERTIDSLTVQVRELRDEVHHLSAEVHQLR